MPKHQLSTHSRPVKLGDIFKHFQTFHSRAELEPAGMFPSHAFIEFMLLAETFRGPPFII